MKLVSIGRLTAAIGGTWGLRFSRGIAFTWLQVGALVIGWENRQR